MLRDPVARLLSTYYFILRGPLHPLHRTFKTERLGLEDLIRLTPNAKICNADSLPELEIFEMSGCVVDQVQPHPVGFVKNGCWTSQKKTSADHFVWWGCAKDSKRACC
jgi:hypothetical protein